MNQYPVVEITERALEQLRKGSLWIFANEFVTKMKALGPGAWVNFQCKGRFAGFGYANPHSLIAGRVLSFASVRDRKELFKQYLKAALKKREALRSAGSFRAVFSESDWLPGLIVDIYGAASAPIVVAQFTTLGMDQAKDDIKDALVETFEPSALVLRGDSSIRRLEGAPEFVEIIRGFEKDLKEGHVKEDDVLFAADFVSGQKTGFFLDQRENRRHLKERVKGKRVLDLCCYSGGWGLTALKGLAEHVTFVDQSADAMELVKRGMKLNGFDESRAAFVVADVFEFLETTSGSFDVIVADPPAFVKSKKNLPQAVKAYKKLNSLSIRKLSQEGILYSCSCSYHLSDQEFETLLQECLQKSQKTATVIHRGGQGLDHPWILNRPESKYLKCLAIRLDTNPGAIVQS